MKTVISYVVIILSVVTAGSAHGQTLANQPNCSKWAPKVNDAVYYRTAVNFVTKNGYSEILDTWIPSEDRRKGSYIDSVTTGNANWPASFLSVVFLPRNFYGGDLGWSKQFVIKDELAKCSISTISCPSGAAAELVTVPAGTFSTCKVILEDSYGEPSIEAWIAPNLPFDGKVKMVVKSPQQGDLRKEKFEMISHPAVR